MAARELCYCEGRVWRGSRCPAQQVRVKVHRNGVPTYTETAEFSIVVLLSPVAWPVSVPASVTLPKQHALQQNMPDHMRARGLKTARWLQVPAFCVFHGQVRSDTNAGSRQPGIRQNTAVRQARQELPVHHSGPQHKQRQSP